MKLLITINNIIKNKLLLVIHLNYILNLTYIPLWSDKLSSKKLIIL